MNVFKKKFIKILKENGPLNDLSGGAPANVQAAPGDLPAGNINVNDPSLQDSLTKTADAGNTPDPILEGLQMV